MIAVHIQAKQLSDVKTIDKKIQAQQHLNGRLFIPDSIVLKYLLFSCLLVHTYIFLECEGCCQILSCVLVAQQSWRHQTILDICIWSGFYQVKFSVQKQTVLLIRISCYAFLISFSNKKQEKF